MMHSILRELKAVIKLSNMPGEALEIGQGDEVILPTFTIIFCAATIVRAGAVPVVVDT
jgi:dTDP-4-amino-4,6-dideoxygalactose transaminase